MASLLDSSDLDPIQFGKDWQYIKIAGDIKSPGAIPRNGITGFERETGWDIKNGKGTAAATLTLKDFPPATGTIAIQLWETVHFQAWGKFRAFLKYTPGKKPGSATAADAIDIYHPALAGLGISSVVTHKISPERHMGSNLYVVTIEFIEWRQASNLSVVATTAQSKTDGNSKKPGDKPNPYADQQAEIKRLHDEYTRAPVGF